MMEQPGINEVSSLDNLPVPEPEPSTSVSYSSCSSSQCRLDACPEDEPIRNECHVPQMALNKVDVRSLGTTTYAVSENLYIDVITQSRRIMPPAIPPAAPSSSQPPNTTQPIEPPPRGEVRIGYNEVYQRYEYIINENRGPNLVFEDASLHGGVIVPSSVGIVAEAVSRRAPQQEQSCLSYCFRRRSRRSRSPPYTPSESESYI